MEIRRIGVALFVLYHVLAVCIDALPDPGVGLRRADWKEATVQAEFAVWSQRVGMEQAAFEDLLWEIGTRFNTARQTLTAPFMPYYRYAGTGQSWQMFAAPHRFPTRFQIQGRAEGGEWETAFEEHNPDATWRRDAFGKERVRATIFRWGWPRYKDSYRKGCKVLAGELFAERSAWAEVRCRFSQRRSPSPEEVRDGIEPPIKWVFERIERRGAR